MCYVCYNMCFCFVVVHVSGNNLHERLKVNIFLFNVSFLTIDLKLTAMLKFMTLRKSAPKRPTNNISMNNICIIHMVVENCYSFKNYYSFYGKTKGSLLIIYNHIICYPLYKAFNSIYLDLYFVIINDIFIIKRLYVLSV